ncbi:MAG: hypothetical protein JWN34_296 [Bryobacterales bacterium]|nr:hypothetical protein [Bryobacterales bacterium]
MSAGRTAARIGRFAAERERISRSVVSRRMHSFNQPDVPKPCTFDQVGDQPVNLRQQYATPSRSFNLAPAPTLS